MPVGIIPRRKYAKPFVQDKTADYTVLASDVGRTFSNLGATSGITFTLPTGAQNLVYEFINVSGYPMVITAGSSDGIYVDGTLRADGSSIMLWQANHSAKLYCNSAGNWIAMQNLPDGRDRITLVENWLKRPALNAAIAPAMTGNDAADAAELIVANIANKDFEILGTSAVSADVTHNAEGGIGLVTHGAADDQCILLPHLDTNQSAWSNWTWGTDQQTDWQARIVTASNITNVIIWAGLKLTNADAITTDNKSCFFRYEDDVSSGVWVANASINNNDSTTVTSVTVAVSTQYDLWINIGPDRIARMFINNVLVKTTAALDDASDFIPYIGIENDGGAGAAKTLRVLPGYRISRKVA